MKKKKTNVCGSQEPRMKSGSEGEECEEKKKKRKRKYNIITRNVGASLKNKKSRRTKTADIRVYFGTEDSH